jgi:putative glycosyltransferase (TIGR04372 family)
MSSQWSKSTGSLKRFFNRNLSEVRSLSSAIVTRKISTLTRVHLPRILKILAVLPIAVLFLVVIRSVRKIVVVRITPLNASRFGHLALDPEMFQAERALNIGSPSGRIFDVWYIWHHPFPISNNYLVDLWRTKLRIWPSTFLQTVDMINRLVPGGEIHVPHYRKNIPGLMNHVQGDPYDVLNRVQPTLAIPDEDRRRMMERLATIGYGEKSQHVCLVVRDSAHFKRFDHVDLSSHDFRNADVWTYQQSAEFLEEQGYFVFRMGQATEREMGRVSDRIIDLSRVGLQSEEMDIFLLSTCRFCLSSTSGPDAVSLAFRRPVLFTNLAQVNQMGLTFVSRFIPRRFVDEHSGDEIALSNIFSRGLDRILSGDDLASRGVTLVPNTSEEILRATEEMHLRLSGGWRESIDQAEKQAQFLSQIPNYLKQGVIRGGICSTFLDYSINWTK